MLLFSPRLMREGKASLCSPVFTMEAVRNLIQKSVLNQDDHSFRLYIYMYMYLL